MATRRYELRVAGRLSDRARGAFADMKVVPVAAETMIYGDVVDDSHLHGLLALCRSLGLEVVYLRELPAAPDGDPPGTGGGPTAAAG